MVKSSKPSTSSHLLVSFDSKLLVTDPYRRITIPAMTHIPWFHKDFTRPLMFFIKDDKAQGKETQLEADKD